jgi:hypothetical protein
VRTEGVRSREEKKTNIQHTIKRRLHELVTFFLRNCLLKHVIEGKTEMTGRRVKGRKQLLNDLQQTKGYWNLKEEALHHTVWGTRFGKGYGPLVRQTTELTNK